MGRKVIERHVFLEAIDTAAFHLYPTIYQLVSRVLPALNAGLNLAGAFYECATLPTELQAATSG